MDTDYSTMLPYSNTPRQTEILESLIKTKDVKKTSKQKGIAVTNIHRMIRAIKRRMALVGDGDHYVSDEKIPEGFGVKGTSTMYNDDGSVKLQWVKTDRQAVDRMNLLREAVSEIVEQVKGTELPVPEPETTYSDQLAVYNIGDAHIGMLAHKIESGDDFDLKIAESDLIAVTKELVKSAPPSETAIIIDLGDFFHADNQENETSGSKNKLDVDGRWHKVLKVGLNIMVAIVHEALTKHKKVIVKNIQGNHNEHSAFFLAIYLASKFENEPRVQIDESPSMFWYYQFGKVLIGSTHGHTVKPQDLGDIMACDCADIWSSTSERVWYIGHVHHDQVKEYRNCKVESFRTLAAKDAWHSGKGYRSGRDMKCIVHHKEYGEMQRHTVNIAMIK